MSNEEQGKFSITGRVEDVLPEETIHAKASGKSYPKRAIVVAYNEADKYPRAVLVEFFGDKKVGLLDAVNVGDIATVHFTTSARKSGARWFGANDGWRIEVKGRAGAVPPPEPNGGGWSAAPDDPNGEIPF